MIEVKFNYGILAETLEQQANEQGFTLGENAEEFKKLKYAINICRLKDVLTDKELSNAIERLNKKVMKVLKIKESDMIRCAYEE